MSVFVFILESVWSCLCLVSAFISSATNQLCLSQDFIDWCFLVTLISTVKVVAPWFRLKIKSIL